MPVRDKAVAAGLRQMLGGPHSMVFNNQKMTATVRGETMARPDFDAHYWDPADSVFEAVVDSIDWNRVFLEANARHDALGHGDDKDRHTFPDVETICPECLREALMQTDWQDWEKEAKVARKGNSRTA